MRNTRYTKYAGLAVIYVLAALIGSSAGQGNLKQRIHDLNYYMIDYGPWDPVTDAAKIAMAKRHQLVILHPFRQGVTRALVQNLQQGEDPNDPADDVLVLGYISVGEDLRTVGLTDDQLRTDARFRGDGSGPRVDPRGYDGQESNSWRPLPGLDTAMGIPSAGGTGFASYYLDDNDVAYMDNHLGDGLPDRNKIFGGAFVNAGDPAWMAVLQDMTLDGPDRLAGFREIMSLDYGRGLGCDGVFLDTVDTVAPNVWTNKDSPNLSKFEWTAAGMADFIHSLRMTYPDKVLLQNRGGFYFDPRQRHFALSTGRDIDLFFYESYFLDSDPHDLENPFNSADNRCNYMPKLMAEANRGEGFKVLSLGYAEGPPGQMDYQTLLGLSTVGYDVLLHEMAVTQAEAGFRDYITSGSVDFPNTFVRDHSTFVDEMAPVWTSTYNDHDVRPISAMPTPRVGVQRVEDAGPAALVVHWDVAIDMHRVSYALYLSPTELDFVHDPYLQAATRVVLEPQMGDGYVNGVGPQVYAHRAQVVLPEGQEAVRVWFVCIRAFDDSPAHNEDQNTVMLRVQLPDV